MNEVEILNKIMQAFSQGGNVVINIINTSNQQNNNISQSTSIYFNSWLTVKLR